ncbi:AAA family ATPase [uncultured Anaerococcus sp.]|uniref:AAA family ATPase n=1 Tax=uncultured Anaerococcus sp. TaxID=293428 RepID=UPI00262BB0A9|nr:SbcC/MukB-like Walker B domain-containing protein [uncultured Anaerococcus sp.]
MKPIKLKVRGFLTYKNEIEIDFTKLYAKKIFVISGDTGSGKTSIFDAISFALYGSVARDIPIDRLRSDFLTGEDSYTFVNLIFEVDGKIYEIERIPSQIAHRSKDYQDIKNSVALYEITNEGKLISEKITETKDKVNEIIGLDHNQFSKVMLLAQGDFQQFLNAKSDERTKLLGDIFRTQEYKEIQENIKQRASEAFKNMEVIDERLESTLYRFDEINKVINKDDILVHDFDKINDSIDNYQINLDKNLQELLKEESELQTLEKEEISYRQNSENLNKNIDNFYQSKENLDKAEEKKLEFENLKKGYDKAKEAKSIEVYENLYNKNTLDIRSNKNQLDLNLGEAEKLEDKLDEVYSSYLLLDKKQENLDEIRVSLNDDDKLLKEYIKFLDIKGKYQTFASDLKEIDKLREEKEYLANKIEEDRNSYDEKISAINKLKDSKNQLEKEIYAYKLSLEKLDESFKILRKNEELKGKIALNNKELKDLEKEKSKLNKSKDAYQKNIRLSQINEMIDDLNQTGICPVCGDKHASKFKKHDIEDIDITSLTEQLIEIRSRIEILNNQNQLYDDSLVDIEDKKKLEAKKDSLYSIFNEKRLELENINNSLEEALDKTNNLKKSLSKNTSRIREINYRLEELDSKAKDFENIKISYLSNKEKMDPLNRDYLEDKIKTQKLNINTLEDEIKNITSLYNELTNKNTRLKSNIENLRTNIKNLDLEREKNKTTLEEKINEVFDSYDSYKDSLNKYEDLYARRDDIDQYFKNLEKLRLVYETYISYKDKKKVDLEKIDKKIASIDQKLITIRDKKSDINLKLSNIKIVKTDLYDIEKEFMNTKKDSEVLSKLAKMAEGSFAKVKGREKIDFESFVLSYYFDKVLSYANIRLLDMSDGQFSMTRKSMGLDARSKQGLDIEILDANTGKKRPASTLSGGESFLASLSLALGLSDEISAENGGIKIDTLFIDEGFGTLSDEYLNNVIHQIEKLSYENKFIGLISHVKELKEAIDAKILVTYRQDEGSSIEVIS